MASVKVSVRLDEALVAWVDDCGETRGAKRSRVIEEAIRSFRADWAGGVPVLESASGMTPRSSPAGREAKSEVALKRTGARATAPQRAPVSAPTRDQRAIPGVKTGAELWRLRSLVSVVAGGPRGIGHARARVRIAEGRVLVDGLVVRDPGLRVDPSTVSLEAGK